MEKYNKLHKQNLGQFNTTRKDYILNGMENFVKDKEWVDPYAGNGDLLEWVEINGAKLIYGYDVDETKKSDLVECKNTLLDPPDYSGKWIIANPPYLARNKCKDKTLYDSYKQDDLYKIAILTSATCEGGIFIVPLNFLSSVYANSIRDAFFEKFKIVYCKIFEETVFDDTDYTVCAFYFERRSSKLCVDKIELTFCPSKEQLNIQISEEFHWILGEEFYRHMDGVKHTGIGRWTEKDMDGASFHNKDEAIQKEKEDGRERSRGSVFINDFNKVNENHYFYSDILKDIIVIRAIDTGTMDGRIGLSNIAHCVPRAEYPHAYPVLLGLETSRNKAHVKFTIKDHPTIDEQIQIIEIVNQKLESFRLNYNSVFLTAFRNSTDAYSRKRISFEVMYKMIASALAEIRSKAVKPKAA